MSEPTLTKEQTYNAINLVASMVISSLAQQQNTPPTTMLLRFLSSETAEMLYDCETKLWCEGPMAVETAFLEEENAKSLMTGNRA